MNRAAAILALLLVALPASGQQVIFGTTGDDEIHDAQADISDGNGGWLAVPLSNLRAQPGTLHAADIDAPVDTPYRVRHRTVSGGVVSPFSDWSERNVVRSIPEPGAAASILAGSFVVYTLKRRRVIRGR